MEQAWICFRPTPEVILIVQSRKTKWVDHPEELEEIFLDVYGYKPKIDHNFKLRICADDDMDLEFLEKARDYKFPNFKWVEWGWSVTYIGHLR